MHKVATVNGYDLYIGTLYDDNGYSYQLYNIVPKHANAPTGGYKNMQYIERVKGISFPERYQPTRHGMRPLYTPSENNYEVPSNAI